MNIQTSEYSTIGINSGLQMSVRSDQVAHFGSPAGRPALRLPYPKHPGRTAAQGFEAGQFDEKARDAGVGTRI
jgi:hypothetical protein